MTAVSFAFKARKLLAILGSAWARRALISHGVAAALEHRPALREIGALRTVVDVGANRGQFALAVRDSNPLVKIISFEPLSGPANVLKQVFAEDMAVQVFQNALGPSAGKCAIHLSGRDDSSSLLAIGPNQDRLFPGTAEVGTMHVAVQRLRDCVEESDIERPALLKLDVQGFELQALNGCDDMLKCFDSILVECSFVELYVGQALASDVIAWLGARGFSLVGLFNLTADDRGRAIQADFLFSQSERHEELAS